MGLLFNLAQSMSMKHLVAPQSMRAWVHHLTTVSVNFISILMVRNMAPGLAAIM
jgi:hypothetical protein